MFGDSGHRQTELRTVVRFCHDQSVALSVADIESRRRSAAMAALSPSAIAELLETCEQYARERAEIAAILANLPESVAALRGALNQLHQLVR